MMMKALLAATAALLVSGCISILPDAPPAPYTYTMRVGEVQPAGATRSPQVISVGTPSTPRMAVMIKLPPRKLDALPIADTLMSMR